MATETIRLGSYVVVATVAKLLLVAVALKAGTGKFRLKNTTVCGSVVTIPLAHHGLAPGNKKLHVVCAHKLRIFHTTYFF